MRQIIRRLFKQPSAAEAKDLISPKDLISQLGIGGLMKTADDYYGNITDPTFHIAKPFYDVNEAPIALYNLGLLLGGMQLAPGMTVLDFGAGTCWLSRFIYQMRCPVICIDPSATALKMGQQLFDDYPVMGSPIGKPQFIIFDGLTFEMPDSSVDRVVSFSAFHHVPNPEQVLAEMFRVLKPGGIVGFVEPGMGHSSAPQSQLEMSYFKVLENDIDLKTLVYTAQKLGFSSPRFRVCTNPIRDIYPDDYFELHNHGKVPSKLTQALRNDTRQNYIFFFTKGVPVTDSRVPGGLHCKITTAVDKIITRAGETVRIPVHTLNDGTALWLTKNAYDIGVVKVGTHLHTASGDLIDYSYTRTLFAEDIVPGQAVDIVLETQFVQEGQYTLLIDLVSEQVCWFERLGCTPLRVQVTVTG